MPRICNREACGKRILTKDGRPDYRKHFCGSLCLKIDKRERLEAKRTRLRGKRCSVCGRKPVVADTSLLPATSEGVESHRPMAV
jgi:hypothetical protein